MSIYLEGRRWELVVFRGGYFVVSQQFDVSLPEEGWVREYIHPWLSTNDNVESDQCYDTEIDPDQHHSRSFC